MHRRAFIAAATAIAGTAARPRWARPQPPRTRLILLGTGAGPRTKRLIASPAQVIIIDGLLYVVDCGDGVARQLVLAGASLTSLRHVFITHHHSDHNADYGNLLLLAWENGLRTRVDTWGPPPLEAMTRLFFELNAFDIETRTADEGRVPFRPLIHPHEVATGGLVMQDERMKVTCTLVDHPPVRPALAYRFDGPDRSIVISGDTNRSANLVKLAQGADVLVHEAIYLPAVDRMVANVPNATTLRQHLIESHTSAEDCGRVAAEAGVRTLVLSHLAPSDDPNVTPQMWIDAARQHFTGQIIVGQDLLEV